MDTDGVQDGFDCELTSAISRATLHPPSSLPAARAPPSTSAACSPRAGPTPRSPPPSFHYETYTVADLKEYLAQCGILCAGRYDYPLHRPHGWARGATRPGPARRLSKAVRRKKCWSASRRFRRFRFIDLDAALGRGSNDAIVEFLAARAVTRVGGGVRSLRNAPVLWSSAAHAR